MAPGRRRTTVIWGEILVGFQRRGRSKSDGRAGASLPSRPEREPRAGIPALGRYVSARAWTAEGIARGFACGSRVSLADSGAVASADRACPARLMNASTAPNIIT